MSTLFGRIHELKVQMVEDQRHSEPHCDFCESLAQADTFTTEERCERQGVPWFTVCSLGPLVRLIACVKAFRDITIRLRPLFGVMMDLIKQNHEDVVLLEQHLLAFY